MAFQRKLLADENDKSFVLLADFVKQTNPNPAIVGVHLCELYLLAVYKEQPTATSAVLKSPVSAQTAQRGCPEGAACAKPVAAALQFGCGGPRMQLLCGECFVLVGRRMHPCHVLIRTLHAPSVASNEVRAIA